MRIKTYAICIYIIFIYWISLHIPHMSTLFFPTLGAFSLLFISRPFEKAQLRKIAIGAILSSFIGSLFVYWSSGVLSLLLTLVIVIFFINKFKWNAPPILSVALIPFFTHTSLIWVAPVSVAGSLLGLLLTLSAAAYLEKRCAALAFFLRRTTEAKSDSAL